MSVATANAAVARAATEPLSEQLRRLVRHVATPATLTCSFVPGGRAVGAGIVSPFHCASCNQALMWHQVAAAIPDVAWAETRRAIGIEPGGIFDVTSDC